MEERSGGGGGGRGRGAVSVTGLRRAVNSTDPCWEEAWGGAVGGVALQLLSPATRAGCLLDFAGPWARAIAAL